MLNFQLLNGLCTSVVWIIFKGCYVMFKNRASVLYRIIKTQGLRSATRAARFLNNFKNIPQRGCVLGVEQRLKMWEEDISIHENQAIPCLIGTLYIKKYKHGVFYQDIEVMHVTRYRSFDRLSGSWIINDFFEVHSVEPIVICYFVQMIISVQPF